MDQYLATADLDGHILIRSITHLVEDSVEKVIIRVRLPDLTVGALRTEFEKSSRAPLQLLFNQDKNIQTNPLVPELLVLAKNHLIGFDLKKEESDPIDIVGDSRKMDLSEEDTEPNPLLRWHNAMVVDQVTLFRLVWSEHGDLLLGE
mmetsp:Transcript_42680/g.65473  ORF Transcript_42680/g.65473 Transcript_42680/m.65473 type:complete len:147 (+) Transcript_42680:3109-3549(+)